MKTMEISLIALGDRVENYTFRLFKALLESKGHRVNLIYLNVCRMGSKISLTPALQEQLLSLIKTSHIVGLYVFTYNFNSAVLLTRYIKENTRALVIWGGPHAIAEPAECANWADIVSINEGEEALLMIIEKYGKDGPSFDRSDIPNIAYKKSGYMVCNEVRRLSFSLDTLPYQDYSFIRHYYVDEMNNIVPLTCDSCKAAGGAAVPYITMIARGCPFRCSYCLNSGANRIPYYNGRSVGNVIGELVEAKSVLKDNIKSVIFYDDDFFAKPIEYIKEFSVKWKERVGIPIDPVTSTAPSFSEEKLQHLIRAGLTGITMGIQTISERGRKSYGNPATKERVREVIDIMKRYPSMRITLQNLLGNPFENADDIAENILFLNSLPKICRIGDYQLIIYPGTRLHEMVKSDPLHYERASEGYHIPYYYSKPQLALWNFLFKTYLHRNKELSAYVKFLLRRRWYFILNIVTFHQVRTAYRNLFHYLNKYGFSSTVSKIMSGLKHKRRVV